MKLSCSGSPYFLAPKEKDSVKIVHVGSPVIHFSHAHT